MGKKWDPLLKNNQNKKAGDMTKAVEHLPNKVVSSEFKP
jgi:hypothetical protein